MTCSSSQRLLQVFYFGIIDFLQYYNAGKKAENLFKSVVSNPLEIRRAAAAGPPLTLPLLIILQCCGTEFFRTTLLGVYAEAIGVMAQQSFAKRDLKLQRK